MYLSCGLPVLLCVALSLGLRVRFSSKAALAIPHPALLLTHACNMHATCMHACSSPASRPQLPHASLPAEATPAICSKPPKPQTLSPTP